MEAFWQRKKSLPMARTANVGHKMITKSALAPSINS
jgi:hypothetical protein